MRKQFSEILHQEMSYNNNIVLITGDLGYGLWNQIKIDYPDRFFDVGSAEQLMMGCAVGMALEGKIPVVYSITSFLLYRPFEFIRNYLDHEKIPVKLVGGGRDKDYGYLGFTHWAEDDKKIMSCFNNIDFYKPDTVGEMAAITPAFLYSSAPSYLNLRRK
jgi:transketolase